MSEGSTFNGWRNRATWLFSLWFSDSIDAGEFMLDSESYSDAVDAVESHCKSVWEYAIDELSLPNWLTDFLDDDIDFREIAESLCSDYRQE